MNILRKLRKPLLGGFAALAMLLGMSTVQAAPVGLALVIDGSGSISSGNFSAQKTGYVAALNNVIPAYFGNIAIGVYQFATGAQTEFSMTLINNAGDLGLVTAAISGMGQLGGATSIGAGIQEADQDMANFGLGYVGLEKAIIDVSTDGGENTSPFTGSVIPPFLANAGDTVNKPGCCELLRNRWRCKLRVYRRYSWYYSLFHLNQFCQILNQHLRLNCNVKSTACQSPVQSYYLVQHCLVSLLCEGESWLKDQFSASYNHRKKNPAIGGVLFSIKEKLAPYTNSSQLVKICFFYILENTIEIAA